MNTKLTDTMRGTGGIYSPKDGSVKLLAEIARDTKPFDWEAGFDIEKRIGHELTTKDQNTASSCGGEAASYFRTVMLSLRGGEYEDQSSKFIYAPIAVAGGGSSEEEITRRLVEAGSCAERLCPSSISARPVNESFMARKRDIGQPAIADAEGKRVKERAYVKRDLDSLAKAVRDSGGAIVGIRGTNNGTWNSKFPKPPKKGASTWNHWMYAGKAITINNKKYVGLKQSWGDVGERGWQWVGEEHMPHLWTAFTYVDLDMDPSFSHRFYVQMQLGDSGPEVAALQEALKLSGEFPSTQSCTGYFGLVTLESVKRFQERHRAEILDPIGLKKATGVVASRTLAKLNSLYGI